MKLSLGFALLAGICWSAQSFAMPTTPQGLEMYHPKMGKAASSADLSLAEQAIQAKAAVDKVPIDKLKTAIQGRSEHDFHFNPTELRGRDGDLNKFDDLHVSIDEETKTRYYDLDISLAQDDPDGVFKKRIVINGQSPGPIIECNEGDTLVIRVKNNLHAGTGIHWHGMYQNSTPWMDGVDGFSQCPIPAGGSFTYKFQISGQYGTYWYHSHSSLQYTDGLYGALIVHSKKDPYQKGRDYDEDKVLTVTDNYHSFGTDIAAGMLSAGGFHGSQLPPSPQSGLINGRGVFDCDKAPSGSKCQQRKTPSTLVHPNKKYRLRIISAGTHTYNYVSVDQHPLTVIAADGTPVKPHTVHRIPIHNGQRYDAILTTDKGSAGDSFLLRSVVDLKLIPKVNKSLDPVANLTLVYQNEGESVRAKPPQPKDWSDPTNVAVAMDEKHLIPAIDTSVPENHNTENLGIFNSMLGNLNLNNGSTLSRFFIDEKTQINYVNRAYLETVHAGGHINSATTSAIYVPDDVWVIDMVLNNHDHHIDHPYHLHGMDSYIVARGSGSISEKDWKTLKVNTINPLRRDTYVIPRSSYAVIRLLTDVPGVWPLHCHINFHSLTGFMAAVEVHPKKIQSLSFPSDVQNLCPTDSNNLKVIIPA